MGEAPEPPASGSVLPRQIPMRTAVLLAAGLAALSCACSPAVSTRPASILPLRTLRLYETGVGYFERAGSLDASAPTSLPVPAGHLDDALQTLVVLDDRGHAKFHGIEFGSSLSRGMARALSGLPADAEAPLGLEQLLVGLRGARVEVRVRGQSGQTRTGRLIDVVHASDDGTIAKTPAPGEAHPADEKARDAKDEAPKPSLTLLMLGDGGEIVRIRAADVDSVRPLDPGYAVRLGSALDALGARGAQSERLLHVLSQGGPVALGYVAETPVWRTTYRLVLDASGTAATLEGWALLHNDTDEDWHGVKVELANGRPDSFLFPLAAPRYARRQLVTPTEELATVPQLMDSTVDAIWGDRIGDAFGNGGLGLSGIGEGGGGRGEGIGLGSIGTIGHGGGTGKSESSSLLEVGNLASVTSATGVEAGALFVYTLPERVDLRARGSALVPFAQEPVNALAIAWVDAAGSPARSAVRFINSTRQTLPPGTIAFFGDGGFAGESALPRLKPEETRYITYGLDLDVELHEEPGGHIVVDEPKRLVWDRRGKTLHEHYLRTSDFTYEIKNRSGHPRTVVLQMPLASNATLAGPDRVEFDPTSSQPLAVFLVEARKKIERRAHSVEGLEQSLGAESLTSAWLTEVAAAASLPDADRAMATEAAARLREGEENTRQAEVAKAEIAVVEKDLERFREHMKALSGERPGAGQNNLINPFAARVLGGEDKLAALRAKHAKLVADAKSKREAAQEVLAKLSSSPTSRVGGKAGGV